MIHIQPKSWRMSVIQFAIPIVAIWIGVLGVGFALHYSMWEIIPTFLFFVCIVGVVWIALAVNFATTSTKDALSRIVAFALWLLASSAIAWGGLMLLSLLPITVGDGP